MDVISDTSVRCFLYKSTKWIYVHTYFFDVYWDNWVEPMIEAANDIIGISSSQQMKAAGYLGLCGTRGRDRSYHFVGWPVGFLQWKIGPKYSAGNECQRHEALQLNKFNRVKFIYCSCSTCWKASSVQSNANCRSLTSPSASRLMLGFYDPIIS